MTREELDKKYTDVNDAYQRGYEQGLRDAKTKTETYPSYTFKLGPSGYEVHPENFEFWFKRENEYFIVSDTRGGLNKIVCRTFMDDNMNGSAEFLISCFGANMWRCDYARIHWQWNVSSGFIMINKRFCPMPIQKKLNYGILHIGKKEMCRRIIQELLFAAYEAMRSCNTEAEFAEKMWK